MTLKFTRAACPHPTLPGGAAARGCASDACPQSSLNQRSVTIQGGFSPPWAVQTWRLTPTGHPSGSSVAPSNTLNLPRRSRWRPPRGLGFQPGGRAPSGKQRFWLRFGPFGATSVVPPPRRPPGGEFGLSRRPPRSRPASSPAAPRPPPRPPGASSRAAQGFLPRPARISSSAGISSRLH